MTAQDKDLLFRDLCARLPYRVRIRLDNYYTKDTEESVLSSYLVDSYYAIEYRNLRPYLRPMSSMTKEEIEEYRNLSDEVIGSYGPYHHEFSVHCVRLGIKPGNPHECVDDFLNMEAIDWLNKKGFDYRGLIPMGLALEAPKDMYKN